MIDCIIKFKKPSVFTPTELSITIQKILKGNLEKNQKKMGVVVEWLGVALHTIWLWKAEKKLLE